MGMYQQIVCLVKLTSTLVLKATPLNYNLVTMGDCRESELKLPQIGTSSFSGGNGEKNKYLQLTAPPNTIKSRLQLSV